MAFSNHDGTWTLTHHEYQHLKGRDEWLTRLESAGVDNWSGIELAIEMCDEEDED